MAAVDSIDREMLQIRDLQRAGELGVNKIRILMYFGDIGEIYNAFA